MRSYLPDFDLATPGTLAGVLSFMAMGEGWRPIAGGTDLMVLLNAGKLAWKRFVAIDGIPELRGVHSGGSGMLIGAATTFTEIRESELLREQYPLLGLAASWTGGVANQNRGTLGGNIANASPAADSAPALLAYNAELVLLSKAGSRKLSYADFHTGYKQMALREDELIAAIQLPAPPDRPTHYGRKVGTRKAQAISKVCLAGLGSKSGETLRHVRIALGSVAPYPLRCRKTEATLEGQPLNEEVIDRAEQKLREELLPITDIRSTAEYRTAVACNLLREFLGRVREQA